LVDYWTNLKLALLEALEKVTIELPAEVTAILDTLENFTKSDGTLISAGDFIEAIKKNSDKLQYDANGNLLTSTTITGWQREHLPLNIWDGTVALASGTEAIVDLTNFQFLKLTIFLKAGLAQVGNVTIFLSTDYDPETGSGNFYEEGSIDFDENGNTILIENICNALKIRNDIANINTMCQIRATN